jgi:hypothetical protein
MKETLALHFTTLPFNYNTMLRASNYGIINAFQFNKQNNAVVIHGESFLMLLPVQVSEASAPALALNYVN